MIEIRFALPEESEAISKLLQTAFAKFESFYTPEAFAATTPSAKEIRERFEEAGAIWVALESQRIIGTISGVTKDEELYIRSLGVLPSRQGCGIGHLLLETVEKYASENGIEKLSLATVPFLPAALRLYEKHGFVINEIQTHGYFGTTLLKMIKKLN